MRVEPYGATAGYVFKSMGFVEAVHRLPLIAAVTFAPLEGCQWQNRGWQRHGLQKASAQQQDFPADAH
jgi:hypothetical protein